MKLPLANGKSGTIVAVALGVGGQGRVHLGPGNNVIGEDAGEICLPVERRHR